MKTAMHSLKIIIKQILVSVLKININLDENDIALEKTEAKCIFCLTMWQIAYFLSSFCIDIYIGGKVTISMDRHLSQPSICNFLLFNSFVIFSNTISGILMLAEQYSSLMFNVANKFFIDPYIFNILCKQWVSEAANLFNKWEYVNPNKKVLSEKTNILFHRMANFHFYLTQVFQKFVRANIAHL